MTGIEQAPRCMAVALPGTRDVVLVLSISGHLSAGRGV